MGLRISAERRFDADAIWRVERIVWAAGRRGSEEEVVLAVLGNKAP
jgi:hypothetical protein